MHFVHQAGNQVIKIVRNPDDETSVSDLVISEGDKYAWNDTEEPINDAGKSEETETLIVNAQGKNGNFFHLNICLSSKNRFLPISLKYSPILCFVCHDLKKFQI